MHITGTIIISTNTNIMCITYNNTIINLLFNPNVIGNQILDRRLMLVYTYVTHLIILFLIAKKLIDELKLLLSHGLFHMTLAWILLFNTDPV